MLLVVKNCYRSHCIICECHVSHSFHAEPSASVMSLKNRKFPIDFHCPWCGPLVLRIGTSLAQGLHYVLRPPLNAPDAWPPPHVLRGDSRWPGTNWVIAGKLLTPKPPKNAWNANRSKGRPMVNFYCAKQSLELCGRSLRVIGSPATHHLAFVYRRSTRVSCPTD